MWVIRGNPITHDGVAMYSGRALDPDGSLGLDQHKLYPVYRPFDELRKACESFNGKPLINNHTMIGTAEGLVLPDEKNIGGTICNVRPDPEREGVIIADLTIFSAEIQEAVESGKVELSLGYFCKYRQEEGEFKGQHYDFIQTDLEGNHIALVDCGRMGRQCSVCDSRNFVYDCIELTEENMKQKKKTLDADDLRAEIADLLKTASDDVLADVKKVLAPTEEPTPTGDEPKDEPTAPAGDDEPTATPTDEPTPTEPTEPTKDDEEPTAEPTPAPTDEPTPTGDEPTEPTAEPKGEDDESTPTACDMAEAMREVSRRDRLYKSVEPLTGAFDHDEMTAKDVAKYAASRLGIPCVDGAEVVCVSNYLAGVFSHDNKASAARAAQDSGESVGPSEAFKKYLA